MTYFTRQENLPIFPNILSDLLELVNAGKINWHKNQICLNTTVDHPSDTSFGVGSLDIDWDNVTIDKQNGLNSIIAGERKTPLRSEDFVVLCDQFKSTSFEQLYAALQKRFHVGRIRIMRTEPRTCYSWHVDRTPRVHYPLKTQQGCLMVIENEICFLPEHTWWLTNTTLKHTAFNSSNETRIHIVAEILENNP